MQGSQCLECKHFLGSTKGRLGLRCEAFPDGIPDGVAAGVIDHTKPIKGDHGIRFEKRGGGEHGQGNA